MLNDARFFSVFIFSILLSSTGAVAQSTESLGQSIYRFGLGLNDEPVRAMVQNDIRVDGRQFACAGCHQRSGFGSSEGGILIPAITGNILFSADESRRSELHEAILRRPAYDANSLRKAIVEGIDANNETLDPVMPRYALNDHEFRALSEYLKILSTTDDAGVGKDTIHLATVFSDDLDAAKVQAIMEIVERYFAEKNSGTRLEKKRAANSPWYKEWHYSAYRKWQLHVWKLSGPEETWPEQLDELYKQQPVFALFGGLSEGDWTPVHTFCENNRVPCLLPNIATLPNEAEGYYSIYFTKGLTGEADVVGKWLLSGNPPATVVQLHDSSDGSAGAAQHTQHALEQSLNVINIDVGLQRSKQRFAAALAENDDIMLVAWLKQDHGWWPTLRKVDGISGLIVSSTLIDDFQLVTAESNAFDVFSVHSYHIGNISGQNRRLRAWARSRDIPLDHLRLQANTYYSLAILGDALQHIRGHFSREYFLEKIEHMSRRIMVSSAYAKLSIAPGQRIMSKGSFIVPVRPDGQLERSRAVWIVP